MARPSATSEPHEIHLMPVKKLLQALSAKKIARGLTWGRPRRSANVLAVTRVSGPRGTGLTAGRDRGWVAGRGLGRVKATTRAGLIAQV